MKKVFLMTAAISAVLLISASAFAAGPIRAIGVDAGYISPDFDGVDGTWTAGLHMDFGLPATNFVINPFVNYWSANITDVSDASFRDWSMGANLKWTIPTAGKVSPFIAAGASAHMLNVSYGSLSEGDTKFGFQTGAGLKIGVSQNTDLIGSGWYNMVQDNADHWSALAGLAWNL